MSRDKQIDEMVKAVCENYGSCSKCSIANGDYDKTCSIYEDCKALYAKGYRKIRGDDVIQCVCYALGCQAAEKIEQKVAREILTAMSSYCSSKLKEARDKANHAMIAYNNDEIRIWLNRQRAYEDIASKVLELEKKYTEEEK